MIRHAARRRASSTLRAPKLGVERLEDLQLLSASPMFGPVAAGAGPVSHPMYELGSFVSNASPPSGAFTPSQIQQAYGFNKVTFGASTGDGTGQTIAIVDAQDDPNIQGDLNAFDAQFGLAAATVSRVNQAGGTAYPSTDSTGGWEMEESLDVEWAHAVAPKAQILLVEASTASDADLLTAVDYASAHANVVSMSWGGGEFAGENSSAYDGHFSRAGVAFVASSGDAGAPASWPATSPNVLAVGGTALTLGSGGTYASEAGWGGSGGGPSTYEAQPSYQAGVVTRTTMRANPDVAYDASPNTGFAVYDSFADNGTSYGWLMVGGTSAGAPQWAALLAIADQGRAAAGQPALDNASPQEVLATLYKGANTAEFHDVTTGTSTGNPNYSAAAGYDYVTGLGSPQANLVIQSLDGGALAPVDHLAVVAASTDAAGVATTVTVTAEGANNATDAGYRGTVHFTSSDAQAGLPANYTFTAADAGSHTFTLTLKTAGTQSFSVADTATAATSGGVSGIVVSPGAATQLIVSGLPTTATAGASLAFTVTAKDAYGNVATGFANTVNFASSDASATLPAAYAFAPGDRGAHAFRVTFQTAGSQSLSINATPSGLTASASGIAVSPAAPISLAATASSTSQINLSWAASAGGSSYLVERSANGGGSWVQVGTTAAGVTTYQDTGLAAGTTYDYRVRTAAGNLTSAYSNTALATTAAAKGTTTVDSLWGSSTTPSENAYASGSYDVGVKFHSDVAGTVKGVRLLQADLDERLYARRRPLVVDGHAAGLGHLHRRDGVGLGAGDVLEPGADRGERDLHRLVHDRRRLLRDHHQRLHHQRRRQRPPARPLQRDGRRQRRVRVRRRLPERRRLGRQLLGRRRLHADGHRFGHNLQARLGDDDRRCPGGRLDDDDDLDDRQHPDDQGQRVVLVVGIAPGRRPDGSHLGRRWGPGSRDGRLIPTSTFQIDAPAREGSGRRRLIRPGGRATGGRSQRVPHSLV